METLAKEVLMIKKVAKFAAVVLLMFMLFGVNATQVSAEYDDIPIEDVDPE